MDWDLFWAKHQAEHGGLHLHHEKPVMQDTLGHCLILLDTCVLLNYYNFQVIAIYLNGNASG